MQVCPAAAKTPATRPLAAAVRSASGKTMLADLPPSSSVAGARGPAADLATAAPVTSEPVNDTWSTPGWVTSHSPTCREAPLTVLNTPGGKPACSNSSASSMIDTGACSDGLATILHPAASAGASLNVSSSSGEFHGRMAATTPTGSRETYPKKSPRPVSTTRGAGHGRPLAVEGRARGPARVVDVGLGGLRHDRPRLARVRVDRLERGGAKPQLRADLH